MRRALMKGRFLAVLLLVHHLFFSDQVAGSGGNHRDRCEALVKRWAEQEIWAMEEAAADAEGDKWRLQELLFFLHVPRTGGRNYNQCFLKNLFLPGQLCPRSYDKLRLRDPSKPNCSLLTTHDDFSILTRLPKTKTSIITNMRDPTSRVLSSYEFAVEVSARFLRRSRASLMRRVPVGPKVQSMSTLDIWPWKYLVPLLQHDLFDRRDARVSGSSPSQPKKKSFNVYDVPSHVMPLRDFVEHPAVHELVHNGATFQVAGITNNSYLKEANEIRSCVAQYEELGNHVLDVAKRRLDGMLYVGLTEKHKASAQILVHLVGRQVASKSFIVKEENTTKAETYADYGGPNVAPGNDTNNSYEDFISDMLRSYEKCSSSLRSSQVHRRTYSLESISPVNFTKNSRKSIPGDLIARILQLNSLDFELYQHAKKLFAMEQEFLDKHEYDLNKLVLVKPTTSLVTLQPEELDEDAGVMDDSVIYIVSCSVVISILALYFFITSFFRRARDKLLQKR